MRPEYKQQCAQKPFRVSGNLIYFGKSRGLKGVLPRWTVALETRRHPAFCLKGLIMQIVCGFRES
jgi:hypothetical protein